MIDCRLLNGRCFLSLGRAQNIAWRISHTAPKSPKEPPKLRRARLLCAATRVEF
jgi:hypothetical protein